MASPGASPVFFGPRTLVRTWGHPSKCAAAGTVHCSLNLTQASRLLGMTRGGRAFPLSAVNGIERGQPAANRIKSQVLLMNNRTLGRPKALEGLRPSFSAHVRWREHGAPVECSVARTVICSVRLPAGACHPDRVRGFRTRTKPGDAINGRHRPDGALCSTHNRISMLTRRRARAICPRRARPR